MQTKRTEDALRHLERHSDSNLEALKEFVRIPSISTDPDSTPAVNDAARWMADQFSALGASDVRTLSTDLHPIVWAEFRVEESAPTVLMYGHYDVQPVDPIDLWESPPFDPVVKKGRLHGRGSSDMKAQVMATVQAVAAAIASGGLPVNVRFLIEGEEEIGSPSLTAALKEHAELFRADVCINPDTGMIAKETPSIQYGLRGLAYFELTVRGPARDLHSGHFGGVVHNPAQALAELIAGMHDQEGRVTLPGFYDRVRELSQVERERLSKVPITADHARALSGVPELWGEAEFRVAERIAARPTLEINGIWGGYTGAGSKTVLPKEAHAKISTRLVPDQEPEHVRGQLERYLEEHAPRTISWELKELAGGKAYICEPDSPAHDALSRSLEAEWGKKPVFWRIGGSVPVSRDLEDIIGVPSLLTGFSLAEDGAHSPNESVDLENWTRGTRALTRFLYDFADSAG